MGIYGEYLVKFASGDFDELTEERKTQLKRISQLRDRDVLVFAADINKGTAQISIDYSDMLPFTDQLSNLKGRRLDLILETPGGSGEVAEDLVKAMRDRYEDVAVIVPGYAKSAGTIMAMAADDILLGPYSGLGPIDAQIFYQGKRFSADALLEGMEKIKREVAETGSLNRAYIPILQGMSLGELQNAENALSFAKILVTQWLTQYKFRTWTIHSSTGLPVSPEDREQRAKEIADRLCDHRFWKTHGRSLKIQDFEAMRLKITDYSKTPELNDAIIRYYTLLQMTFATNLYKIFETADSQVVRFLTPQLPAPPRLGAEPSSPKNAVIFDFECGKCRSGARIQANLVAGIPLALGCVPFPSDSLFVCAGCNAPNNLADARRQIEAQFRKSIVF